MSDISVEVMQEADLDEVIALGLATPELHVQAEEAIYYSKENLLGFIKSPHDIYLVAKVNNNFAGYRLATFNPYLKEAYLIDMVVRPEYRGLGIASKLYNKTFEMLDERDCEWAWALVKESNTKMMEVMKKKGFTKGSTFKFYFKEGPFT
jgi:ribosomal protein S18 acetylase RimI-like enzyme